jgi:hypothetical protein
MAKLAPFFLTGANAKVKVNNKTIAFCTDLSYSVQVNHAAPKVLGMYEASSLEPLSYEVTGTFTVIRYVAGVAETNRGLGYATPNGVSDKGNGVGALGPDNPVSKNIGNDGRTQDALNPETFENATFFNIDVFQKMADGNLHGVARIRDCRITRADFSIAGKTAPAVERYSFRAIYVDEDSFLAGFSGQGQQFS